MKKKLILLLILGIIYAIRYISCNLEINPMRVYLVIIWLIAVCGAIGGIGEK